MPISARRAAGEIKSKMAWKRANKIKKTGQIGPGRRFWQSLSPANLRIPVAAGLRPLTPARGLASNKFFRLYFAAALNGKANSLAAAPPLAQTQLIRMQTLQSNNISTLSVSILAALSLLVKCFAGTIIIPPGRPFVEQICVKQQTAACGDLCRRPTKQGTQHKGCK